MWPALVTLPASSSSKAGPACPSVLDSPATKHSAIRSLPWQDTNCQNRTRDFTRAIGTSVERCPGAGPKTWQHAKSFAEEAYKS